jgi:CheY-like chemotaxis protein/HPt (histidine-containing phosphotransfer) domain-containing protein
VTEEQVHVTGQSNADAGVGALRLLVVDDDPLGRSMMEIMLAPHGYRIEFACDGQEALKAIESQHYDLVFMDLVLPDMNGMDVSRHVREREAGRRHLPIIAVTAFDLPGQPLQMIKAGLDDYIFKPYDVRGLRRMIQLYTHPDEHDGLTEAGAEGRRTLTESPVLDYKSSLADLSGDAAGYRELLTDFLAALPVRLEKMVQAQGVGDYERLGRETHSLKGISAGLGAMRLSRLAAYLNYCCGEGPRLGAAEALERVRQGMIELQEEAKSYLASSSG